MPKRRRPSSRRRAGSLSREGVPGGRSWRRYFSPKELKAYKKSSAEKRAAFRQHVKGARAHERRKFKTLAGAKKFILARSKTRRKQQFQIRIRYKKKEKWRSSPLGSAGRVKKWMESKWKWRKKKGEEVGSPPIGEEEEEGKIAYFQVEIED